MSIIVILSRIRKKRIKKKVYNLLAMKDDTNIRYLIKLNIGELNWKLCTI